MSTTEKILMIIIACLLIPMIFFSVREIQEPPEHRDRAKVPMPSSGFDEIIGQDFRIGTFASSSGEKSSPEIEAHCDTLQPVILGVLHDVKERLETRHILPPESQTKNMLEVNPHILELFCHTTAEVTLTDATGTSLVLQKQPFKRFIPEESGPEDIGTEVRIEATIVPKGAPIPPTPTTYGDVFIPDRFLDNATSS